MTGTQPAGTADNASGSEMPYPDPHPADPADDLTPNTVDEDDASPGAAPPSANDAPHTTVGESDAVRTDFPNGTPTPTATPTEAPSDPRPQ